MTLLLKPVLVPGLIALVTLAGRRFGPRIGGWLNARPRVAGPALFFLAVEQGDAFVARAAQAALAGLAAVAAFMVIYSWTAVTRPWWLCVIVGWIGCGVLTVALQAVHWTGEVRARARADRLRDRPLPAPATAGGAASVRGACVGSAPAHGVRGGAGAGGDRVGRLARPAPRRCDHALSDRHVDLARVHARPAGRAGRGGFLRAFLPASFVLFCFILAVGVGGSGTIWPSCWRSP